MTTFTTPGLINVYTDVAKVRAGRGCICIIRTGGFVARLIRLVTRGPWNHAAVAVGFAADGTVLISQETPRKGDVVSRIDEIGATRVAVVWLPMDASQASEVVRFAQWAVGQSYGFLTLFADLFNAVTNLELDLGFRNHMVCSTATARAAERTGWIPPKAPAAMSPNDLARAFGVPR